MDEFGKRLRTFREEHLRINKTKFADLIKSKQQYIGHWESGRNKPDSENLLLIQKACPTLNINWLQTGEGEMVLSKPFMAIQKNTPLLISEPQVPYLTGSERKIMELQEKIIELQGKLLEVKEKSS